MSRDVTFRTHGHDMSFGRAISAAMRTLAVEYPTYPMFDRRAFWLYGLLAVSVFLELGLLFALGLRLDSGPILAAQSWPLLIVGAWASRRIGFDRLATSLEALALLYGQALALCFSTAVLATISGPLVDDWLAGADRWLGFEWLAYYQLSRPYLDALRVAYHSFTWLPVVVIIGLAIEHQHTRVWQFVIGAMLALIVTIVVFPFMPAASPIIIHQVSDPDLGGAANFWPIMSALRDGTVRTIGLQHVAGMVSFPSYHTVAAVLIAWAAWGSRWLRWPVAAMCVAMGLAIPTIGDHYIVDVIGGAMLGVVAIPIAKRLVRSAIRAISLRSPGSQLR